MPVELPALPEPFVVVVVESVALYEPAPELVLPALSLPELELPALDSPPLDMPPEVVVAELPDDPEEPDMLVLPEPAEPYPLLSVDDELWAIATPEPSAEISSAVKSLFICVPQYILDCD